MAGERDVLTAAQDVFIRILADAVVEDLLSEVDAAASWVAVRCADGADQFELAERLRSEGREVMV